MKVIKRNRNLEKLKAFGWMLGLAFAFEVVLYNFSPALAFYDKHVFAPFQSGRSWLMNYLSFSLGDILYLAAGVVVLLGLGKWLNWCIGFRQHKADLLKSILISSIIWAACLLFFIVGWGGNYAKEPLAKYWHLPMTPENKNTVKTGLIGLDEMLVSRLNTDAPKYRNFPFEDLEKKSVAWYRIFTDSKVKAHGLHIKSSLYSYPLEHMGFDGYYNPFTGEGEINSGLPGFLLPFLICHEMAHQTGIAAEGDANLLAYAVATTTDDPTFNYSAALNIWIYANAKLRHFDSVAAHRLAASLNPLTLRHLDTLEMLSRECDNAAARAGSDLYDDYLKANLQSQGIRSYGSVTWSAWQWELERRGGSKRNLKIPI
jgi:Protein of unknown function (DUF3810)